MRTLKGNCLQNSNIRQIKCNHILVFKDISKYSYKLYFSLYHNRSPKSGKSIKCLKYEDSIYVILNRYEFQILHTVSQKFNINLLGKWQLYTRKLEICAIFLFHNWNKKKSTLGNQYTQIDGVHPKITHFKHIFGCTFCLIIVKFQ